MFGISTAKAKRKQAETQRIIAEIHDSFDRAADKALEEAKIILGVALHPVKASKEVIMLKKVGFSNARLVADHSAREKIYFNAKSDREKVNERATIVEKWAVKYPQFKFIFMDQVTAICEKYGLVCGSVDRYVGDVPKKNIQEIASFKVKEEDIYFHKWYDLRKHGLSPDEMDLTKLSTFITTDEKMREEQPYKPVPRPLCNVDSSLRDLYYRAYMDTNTVKNSYAYAKVPFYICAPASDMNVSKDTKRNGVFLREVPDPIVLHFVKDGFLIVSKWGLEGNDPSLTNENMN